MPIFSRSGTAAPGLGLTDLTFPLDMPIYPAPSSLVFQMSSQVAVLQSPFTFSRQVQQWQGDRWMADITLPPMQADNARVWCAWLAALGGRGGTFLLGDDSHPFGRGVPAGAPKVNGANQSGRVLVTDGWTPSSPQVRRSGDYIQLGSGAKSRLHMVLLDVDADAGGIATLNIFPRLRELTTDNSEIVVNRPRGVFALASNDRQFTVDSAMVYGISFSAEEAI